MATILPRVIDAQSPDQIVPIVREELGRWFGGSLTNPAFTHEELASEFFQALERHRAGAV